MSFSTITQTKILIIEDDAYMQLILSEFLNETYKIETCDTVLDALTYLQNGNMPDLIISDLNTPQISGLELIDQLKASDFFKSIPIIMISGDDSSDKRIKCLNSGADDYIVKPFNPAELEARIRVVLKRNSK
ncbi:response regulator transcription factor [Mucilaginibacter corticis]|uniref:Response regulator transcription factor n=1 Tax=Mucilaginibacter corticis TaxID=2597670 RepID=A0A556MLF9_9SPHI|nr:response regulator transcription factor [Mucilaginibacter corticis]TSJ40764.1 response regulator transcription factor [Mucilaginibacter corticis]